MKSTRSKFEEIWPVPIAVVWSDELGAYEAESSSAVLRSIRHNARLDTFTRCQETMAVYAGIVDEMICEMDMVIKFSSDFAVVGLARESIGRAKQKLEQIK
jgi:hypothetical protein